MANPLLDITPLRACVDCLWFVAYGEVLPDSHRSENALAFAINQRWPGDVHVSFGWPSEADDNPDDDCLGFSWQPCECCGSRLGGDRHKLSAIRKLGVRHA